MNDNKNEKENINETEEVETPVIDRIEVDRDYKGEYKMTAGMLVGLAVVVIGVIIAVVTWSADGETPEDAWYPETPAAASETTITAE